MSKLSPFHLSSVVSCAVSSHFITILDAYAKANNVSRSAVIRNALLHFAHKAESIDVPPICIPRHPAHRELMPVDISTNVKPDSLRNEYKAHAEAANITMSVLTLRCLYAYIQPKKTFTNTED